MESSSEQDFDLKIEEGSSLLPFNIVFNDNDNDNDGIIEFNNELENNQVEKNEILNVAADNDNLEEEKKENWNQIKQFQSAEEGKVYLKQKGYKQLSGGQVKNVNKTTIKYLCTVDSLCNAKRQLIVYSSFSIVLSNNNNHNGCELSKLNSKDMDLLIKSGASTKMIISTLNLVSSSQLKTQIKNKKYYEKKKISQLFVIHNEEQLISWCVEKKLTYGNYVSNPDEPFVVDYIINNNYYCIVFTTFNLIFDYLTYLSQVQNKLFQCDGTYKLVKNNYILLISGCQDLAGIFHSCGYCMTSNEDTDSYSFLMATLKDVASKIKLSFEINYLMNDGSKAAIAAGKDNFSNYTQLMCRFHAKFNIQKKLPKNIFQKLLKKSGLKLTKK